MGASRDLGSWIYKRQWKKQYINSTGKAENKGHVGFITRLPAFVAHSTLEIMLYGLDKNVILKWSLALRSSTSNMQKKSE